MSAVGQADLTTWLGRWPHRDAQVARLARLLAHSTVPDMLVYGPPCTGKTGVVRDLVACRKHAYIKCCRSSRLRPTLAAVISQLAGSKRRRADAYAAPSASSDTGLVAKLQGDLAQWFRRAALGPLEDPRSCDVLGCGGCS